MGDHLRQRALDEERQLQALGLLSLIEGHKFLKTVARLEKRGVTWLRGSTLEPPSYR